MSSAFLVRFAQAHETFRQPELEALAELHHIRLSWLHYEQDSPFAIIALEPSTAQAAERLIARSILVLSIHEFWGKGEDYGRLHEDVRSLTATLWPRYRDASFRFDLDAFRGSQPLSRKREIIESFSYIPFEGPIVMKHPDQVFTIFEDYELHAAQPRSLFFGRYIAESQRKLITRYDLKKRKYIATTSMDAELSLLTANIAKAAPGKLAYDPFTGTGSFPVSCAAFGAAAFGSDLDGRSIRGKGAINVASNFQQYGTSSLYLGGLAADLTNTPIIDRQILDLVICDPPYGVREGLKVLGHVKTRLQTEVVLRDGIPAHLHSDYIPPKRPYSFLRLIDDILEFSASRLVTGGRLCMWMPVAGNQESQAESDLQDGEDPGEAVPQPDYAIPQHPCLKLESVCQQSFNKWARRLITYSRLPQAEVDLVALAKYLELRLHTAAHEDKTATTADDLNSFRKQYFAGFRD